MQNFVLRARLVYICKILLPYQIEAGACLIEDRPPRYLMLCFLCKFHSAFDCLLVERYQMMMSFGQSLFESFDYGINRH